MQNRLLVACFLALIGSLSAQNCILPVRFPEAIKAPLRQVIFNNDRIMPQDKEREISENARARFLDTSSLDKQMRSLAVEAAQQARAYYQSQGYFNSEVTGEAVKVADEPLYDIAISVRGLGKQYRVGDLNITGAALFPMQQLLDLIPIQRGEPFSPEQITAGLEAVHRIYFEQGYLNLIPLPLTHLDDTTATIDLDIAIDEGKQFRFHRVTLLGLDNYAKMRVLNELSIKPGDTFSPEAWDRSIALSNVVQELNLRSVDRILDEKKGLVEEVLDFRKIPTCPSLPSGTSTESR